MNFKRKIKINDRFIIPIFIASFIIIIILLFEYGNIISKNVKYKKFAKENVQVFENNKEQVFKVEKILICSSANAIDLSEKQNLQDMSIYQYTDIAVYINNGEELTNKNTIKRLYIDNISLEGTSDIGQKSLNYKNILKTLNVFEGLLNNQKSQSNTSESIDVGSINTDDDGMISLTNTNNTTSENVSNNDARQSTENYNSEQQENQNENMAENALRVIAVGYKELDYFGKANFDLEENLIFVGLIGMIDPPRDGVKEAVYTCQKAGIKTVMITGDHIATAKAIAKDLGILKTGEKAITGNELNKISDEELERNIASYSVFARVTPEHKVRIVKAWQKQGKVVAMTGDGVNDSPALKNADIGIAMGKGGTDVAKNASDMILADDNFVTIIEAVRQGRTIYDNIKKAIHFLIATNIGEITTIFIGLLSGMESPLLAIQLLWINLVTDSFPAIALGLEREEEDIMNRKPRNSKESIFAGGLWQKIITEGVMLGCLTLFAFSLGTRLFGLTVGRTMAFVSLGMLELVHSFNVKSEESIFKVGVFENKYLIGSLLLGTLLQVIVVVVPYFANIFELVPLTGIQWIYTGMISVAPIVVGEVQKKLKEIGKNKKLYLSSKNSINY